MKRSTKLLFLCAFVVVLIAGLSMNSMAVAAVVAPAPAPAEISVQLNDKLIEFESVKPVEQNGRTYVPLRSVFESMGAKVSYDDATQTITAVRGDTTATFTVGYMGMQIANASGIRKVALDAAPYLQNDRTMIPVRYAAEAFGCTVAWDGCANAVLILDIDGIIEESGAKFTLVDKMLNSSRDNKNYAVEGSFDMSVAQDNCKTNPVKIAGTFSGLQNSEIANLDMSMNFDSMIELFGNDMTDAEKQMLKNIKMKAIVNNTTGKMYLQADILSAQLGIAGNVWYLMDCSKVMPNGLGIMSTVSFKDYLKTLMASESLVDKEDLDDTVYDLRQTISLCDDKAFTVSGNKYTNIKTYADGLGFKFEIVMDNGKALSYDLAIQQKIGDTDNKLSLSMDESKNFSFVYSTDDYMSMTMKMKMTETSKSPESEPEAGSVIIDANKMGEKDTL